MAFWDKIQEIAESAESIELKIYRNRVRGELLEKLDAKRNDMLKKGKLPYRGEWLTRDEIVLSLEEDKKKNFARVVLVILIYLLLLVISLGLVFFVWRTVH